MTDDHSTGRRLGLPPRGLVVLVLIVALAVGGWTFFWVTASGRADRAFTDWLAVEAAQGRVHSCEERRTGGYPFRFELVCTGPRVTLSAEPEIVASGRELRAVLQVWQPDHVIVEVDGPVRIAPGPEITDAGPPLVASWDLMQASLRVPFGELRAIDIASDGFSLRQETGQNDTGRNGAGRDPLGQDAAGGFSLQAGHIEIHQRSGTEPAARDAMDLAMSASDLLLSYPGVGEAEPVDIALRGSAAAVTPDVLAHPRDFLPRWQAAGGSLTVSSFVAQQDETRLMAHGNVQPLPEGQVHGDITVALAGPDVKSPGTTKAFGGIAPVLATALSLVGERTEIEGEPVVQGTLSLREGKAFLGNFAIADVPRLF